MKKSGIVLVTALLVVFGMMYFRKKKAMVDATPPPPIEQLQREADEACKELEKRQLAFDQRFPTEKSQSEIEVVLSSQEWFELQRWTEGCNQAAALVKESQIDFDRPVPLEILEREVALVCEELNKRQIAFNRRFPTERSRSDNDAVLKSPEWQELMRWTEGCDQAEAQVEEARARTKQGTIP